MKSTFQIISPVNGEIYAERSYADDKSIQSVLEKARQVLPAWRATQLTERTIICRKMVDYFKANAESWGMELTWQMGRPIRYSAHEILNGFTERAEYMIDCAVQSLAPINASERHGFRRFIKKEPLGTILVLAPWNYPYLTVVNTVVPAIMAGNCVILKHANQTALCAEHFLEAYQHAGLPEGVFQILNLTHEQVENVISNNSIAHVSFTGSVEGGQAIQRTISNQFITAGLELGGKDPAYVTEDAYLPNAIENLVDGAFFNSGQSCCSVERIYVDEKISNDFLEGFLRLTKKYVVGNPTLPETTLGPMVRISNARKAANTIRCATEQGAKALIEPSDFPSLELPWLAPQVLTNVNHSMQIMNEESFAPVVGIMSVKDEGEAIRLMNDSLYGLTASIWTKDPEKAVAIGDQIDTGTWYMNRCDYLDPELVWTGTKNSGRGCTLSTLGYDYLTRPKSYHLKLSWS